MPRAHIVSKMNYHSELAAEAWVNGNLADYAIESARFGLAVSALNRLDRQGWNDEALLRMACGL